MADNGVAFCGQLVNQAAHAQLIVGIAALQRVDFRMNERLKLGRAGNGALDAVIHGGHFAANRLANRHNPLGCDRFRLCETQRDFCHGACGIAQILGTRHHDGEGEEQHDRNDDADHDRHQAGNREKLCNRAYIPDLAAINGMRKTDAGNRPEDRYDRCIANGARHGAGLQRSQDHGRATLGAVIGSLKPSGS